MLLRTLKSFSAIFAVIAMCAALSGCGGGGGGGAAPIPPPASPPALSFTTPQNGAAMSDIEFRHEDFNIGITYSGTSPMNAATLAVTLKMDAAAAQNITQYFTVSGANITSADNLYEFNRSLFPLASNDVNRTMRVTATISDTAGRTGSAQIAFEVYPDAPPPN